MKNQNSEANLISNHKKLSSPFHSIIMKKSAAALPLPRLKPPFSYFSALLAVLLVIILQNTLFPDPTLAPFIFFFPAIYLVSFLGGWSPGLLAVVLSALAGNFFFVAPYQSWSFSFEALIATFLFTLSSLILVSLSLYFRSVLANFDGVIGERVKAEADVKRANEEWNRTFDAISDLVFIQDKNFVIVRANRAFAEMIKLNPENIIGKKCYEVLHKSDKHWPSCPFEKTRVDKKTHTEEVFDPKIGRPLLVTTSPIFGPESEFLGSVHIAKDITELKQSEAALSKSEEGMQRAQAIAHLGSWELDLVNNKLAWSNEVYRIFGLEPREFGATYEAFLDAVHPDDRELVHAAYSDSVRQGKDFYEIEHRVVRKLSGEIRIVYEKCQHAKDKSGRIIRSIGMIHDITDRKRMEERLRMEMTKAEALLFSIGDGVVAVDPAGKILFINQAFAELVKKSKDNLLGERLDKIVPMEDGKGRKLPPDSTPVFLALAKGQKISSNIFSPTNYISQNGSLMPLAITATPVILDGAIIGAIAVYRDISKEKAIDQAKTEFVSLASHQLRTPLSSIALSTELLLRGTAGELSSEQKKYLSEAYNSTKIMAELIKVLLNISRIELGTFMVQLEPINLAESLDYLLDELKLQLDSKKLTLRKNYGQPSMIQFDKNILRITIENLITNAIRYTGEGGTIAVSLEEKAEEMIIKIADTGCGIPEKDKDKIFTKLFRAENARLISADGAGLGLYLVKSLLLKVGARIWVESELGKGATFFVAIPVPGLKN